MALLRRLKLVFLRLTKLDHFIDAIGVQVVVIYACFSII